MKIAIVGVGHVGAALAYSLLNLETASELMLVGRNQGRLQGETLDLRHASSFFDDPPLITYGRVEDCRNADIIVLTLAVPQIQLDRNAMAADNAALFRQVVPLLAEQNPAAVLIVATNPVEALTQYTIELSGFPPSRVMGAGTIIDSCRFRLSLSEHLSVHPDDVRAYVLGEHGDSQFLWQSGASVGGVTLDPADIPQSMIEAARSSGTDVFRLKGHTCYAISEALQLIIRSIAGDRLQTMPVSTQVNLGDEFPPLCLALPCIVGRTGVTRRLQPKFSEQEYQQWLTCGQSVARTLEAIRETSPEPVEN
ncbi:malate dehydrogenase [Aeoliella mucimassa]|uniref:L-lactate dehydrogenase n=1 Tax=Aeoliella mucimassa TaxID=2527972 RepID=A0A518ATW2_9BACT|nr:lactate dehydrogenase [Aeoliella mucimassa]QDU58163.1 L-lactate dehydrogenase [Aeoliella mucimassa]